MSRGISPEEKLLALIKRRPKEKDGRQPAAATAQTALIEKEFRKKPRPAAEKRRRPFPLLKILPADIYKGIFISPRILRPLNRCLGVLVVIIGSYLIFELLFVRPYKNITPLIARAAAVTKPSSSRGGPAVSARRDYTAYAGDIKGKKIFSPPSAGGAPAQPPPMASTDISNEIGLVGVIQGDAPQAIIEDKRTQKTYYVSVSESFEGFIVEEIDGDKVIVTRDGKRMSISL